MGKPKHSLSLDRPSNAPGQRSKATVQRLKMYKAKEKKDAKGKVIRPAPFQSKLPSGTMARVEPNRRWFGNTRVITQNALQQFKQAVKETNPMHVVLRRSKLPITLLDERKKKGRYALSSSTEATVKKKPGLFDSMENLVSKASNDLAKFEEKRAAKVLSDQPLKVDNPALDKALPVSQGGSGLPDSKDYKSFDVHFRAGHGRRLWGELYKVLDSSDVVLHVLDARNPLGTLSKSVEDVLTKEKPHVHQIYVLNKTDLVPSWAVKKWKEYLCRTRPTVAFASTMKHAFGKKDLLTLLQQMASFHKDKMQIAVGMVGYPNVGKSSLINTLRGETVCKSAPIPGETKVWQYITLQKRIHLIDCPGVVPRTDTDPVQSVLKGVVRVDYIDATAYVDAVLSIIRKEHLRNLYDIKKEWQSYTEFLELLAVRYGKLLKGGEPDTVCSAKIVLQDFQRGKLPYFYLPPDYTDDKKNK